MPKEIRKRSIGVFDSGFGGLSILKGIVKEMPDYDYVYLGDTARAPYGNRSQKNILEFTEQAVDFLFKNDCDVVILACNTASSNALRSIQQNYLPKYHPDKKVLGVLIPGAEEVTFNKNIKNIAIFATEATVSSGSFRNEILKIDPKLNVFEIACPLLVPIVESGDHDSDVAEEAIKSYIEMLPENICALILGCTHYGILKDKIKKYLPKEVLVISEDEIIGVKLNDYLMRHPEVEERLSKNNQRTFYSTDITDM
ncbi:MAG: glutamate racemase, partial [bacterium]